MNTIKQKIGRGLAGLVLASGLTGLAAGTSGCTTEGNAFGQGLVQGAIITGVGGFASGMGNEAGRQAAGGGPTGTTIVNNNGYGAPQQQYVQPEGARINTQDNLYRFVFVIDSEEKEVYGRIILSTGDRITFMGEKGEMYSIEASSLRNLKKIR